MTLREVLHKLPGNVYIILTVTDVKSGVDAMRKFQTPMQACKNATAEEYNACVTCIYPLDRGKIAISAEL